MKRIAVSWSNSVDEVTGPCVVCGGEIHLVLGVGTPSPALLYHATCDPISALRANLKSVAPPLLPPEFTIHHKK